MYIKNMRIDTFGGTCTAGSSDSRVAGCCKHMLHRSHHCYLLLSRSCVSFSPSSSDESSLSTVDVTQNRGLKNDFVNITDVVKYLFSKRLVCVARLVL